MEGYKINPAFKITQCNPIVVYTNNYWLYQGIKCSLKNFDVFHHNDECIDFNQQKMIFVDGNILLEGTGENVIAFIHANCIDRIVWLTGHDTGMVYPLWAAGDRVISINENRDCFSPVLRAAATELSMEGVAYYARLSPTEALILNYLAKGFSITQIAFMTDRSTKTVYQHRLVILRKLGYKNAAFMQSIFLKFGKLMWTNRRPHQTDISAASWSTTPGKVAGNTKISSPLPMALNDSYIEVD